MSDRHVEKHSDGGEPAKHGIARRIIGWVLGGGAVGLALVVLQLMQAPQTVVAFHEWMCGWARGPAGMFGDCADHAQKPTQTVIIRETAPIASTDPLELLTRRGYTADHSSMYRAISLGRKEDVELHQKAGVKMGALPIVHVPVAPEMWQFLVRSGIVVEPCNFRESEVLSAQWLLDGVLKWKGNLSIYKNLCDGRYVESIAAAAAKARSSAATRAAEGTLNHSVFYEKFERAMASRQ